MSGSLKIAGAAAIAGLMLAAIVGMALRHAAPSSPSANEAAPATQARIDDRLARCRTITMPDSGCEAAWDAERRRFFKDDRP